MTTLLISDLHAHAAAPRIVAGLNAFIEREAMAAEAIYILGDLAEAWIGDDDDSAEAAMLRDALARAARRCAVRVMRGNRDFLFGERFAADTGVTLIDDPHVVELAGQRALLAHGDAYCTRDADYQRARAMFRSAEWQRAMLSQPLAARREAARRLRAESRAANANKADNIMDVTPDAAAAAMREHDCAIMVHGHTHRPGIHDARLGGEAIGRRYVLGDWEHCGWALHVDAGIDLERFALPRAAD